MAEQENEHEYLYMLPCTSTMGNQEPASSSIERLAGVLLLPIDADATFYELDNVAEGELAFELYDSQNHTPEHLVTRQ